MAVFIETCPKCGRDLTKWQVTGDLPFTEHYICLCGFEWHGNIFERRIPFEPPTVTTAKPLIIGGRFGKEET